MFCQKCGSAVTDGAAACPSCSVPIGPTNTASAMGDTVKTTSRHAWSAVKTMAGNPVAGMPAAYEALGDAAALRVGVALGLVSIVCFLLGPFLLLPSFVRNDLLDVLGFGGVMKAIIFALVPFVGTALGSLAVRKFLHGQGGMGGDCFIAGASLLPTSLSTLLAGIEGEGTYIIIVVLGVFAGCFGVLMLFAGYTRITKVSERAATLAVPIVVVLTLWLAQFWLDRFLATDRLWE